MSTPTKERSDILPPEEVADQTPLSVDEVIELRELGELASQARGSWYPQEISDATVKFSELLNKYYKNGVSFTDLGLATGMKWRSVKARLARHGFIGAPPSQKGKVFRGPLTKEDRQPKCDHDPERWRERYSKDGRLLRIECLDCRKAEN